MATTTKEKELTVLEDEALPAAVADDTTTSVLAVIDRAARDPATDVDKLERLLGMYERIEARTAEKEFNIAMMTAQSEMPKVFKDAENSHTKSKYATLETLNTYVSPVITSNGFSMSFGTADSPMEGHYRVTCRLSHAGGHSVDYHADVPSDTRGAQGASTKTATHGFGSTMSYGRRYLTLMIFNISTTDDDDGTLAGGPIDGQSVNEINDLIQRTSTNTIQFCRYFGWDSIAEIPARQLKKARGALEAKLALKDG